MGNPKDTKAADLLIGCCGWAEGRSRYFQDFPAVELQTTFYQPPRPDLAAKWRAEAPPGFVFTLKAWQLITHPASSPTYRRLQTPIDPARRRRYGFFRCTDEVRQAWQTTLAIVRAVRAAVILFQCPASFEPSAENRANLERFFRGIERGPWLLAWEPRGAWQPEQIGELCRALDLIHCVDPFAAQPSHGRVAYFRLHGRGGYRYRYTDQELHDLAAMCRREQQTAGRRST